MQLQRLDALSRSPIQAHCSESLNGMVTIKAFECARDYIARNYDIVDENTAVLLAFTSSQ
ncbi:hypothetical protein SARC_16601, partial [Sphaeroforma arctica JP610]